MFDNFEIEINLSLQTCGNQLCYCSRNESKRRYDYCSREIFLYKVQSHPCRGPYLDGTFVGHMTPRESLYLTHYPQTLGFSRRDSPSSHEGKRSPRSVRRLKSLWKSNPGRIGPFTSSGTGVCKNFPKSVCERL